uniref:Uncharacterized protein n=1 Tax=Toxoplasma gondii TgCATBr9 TaxID=943120 RepID=A0A2T6IUY7_TOXGO|nr:hypothetical protein TGBR9_364340 [Toxoplasma gondii TgCATBr9]
MRTLPENGVRKRRRRPSGFCEGHRAKWLGEAFQPPEVAPRLRNSRSVKEANWRERPRRRGERKLRMQSSRTILRSGRILSREKRGKQSPGERRSSETLKQSVAARTTKNARKCGESGRDGGGRRQTEETVWIVF